MITRFASVAVVAFLSFAGSLVSDAQAETAAQRRPAEQRLPAATSGGKIFIQTGKPVVSRNNVDLKGKAGPGNPPGVALNGKAGPGTSDIKGKAGPGNPPGAAAPRVSAQSAR
jgi:hypothetical protein